MSETVKKKILFVCHGYYPEPSPTGFCVKKVLEKCKERGYDAICLTGSRYQDSPFEIIDGIPVYRVKYPLFMRIFHSWRKMNRLMGWPIRFFIGIYARIHNLIFLPLWPFKYYSLYRRYYSKLMELQTQSNIDLIVAVNNPIEALVAVNNFKKNNKNVRKIDYYIDALSGGNDVKINEMRMRCLPWRHYFYNSAKRWELSFSYYAEATIVMEAAKQHYYKNFTDKRLLSKLVFLNVPLLDKPLKNPELRNEDVSDIVPPEKKMILFCGRIYKLRDPSYIIQVIQNFDAEDIVWVFVGTCVRCYKDIMINAQKRFPERIMLKDQVSHDSLTRFLDRADFFLNIGESAPSVVSGKVFEYMSYGKPIISTVPIQDNSSIKVLEKYTHSLLLFDRDDINISIRRLKNFILECMDTKVSFENVRSEFYSSTPDAFVDVIDEVLDRR